MITLYLEKLYRYPRIGEHMAVAVPFKKGALMDISKVRVLDGEKVLPVQCKATAYYADKSVKYLLVRFMGDLPGNAGKEFNLDFESATGNDFTKKCAPESSIELETLPDGYRIANGSLQFEVRNHTEHLFETLSDGNKEYTKNHFVGPLLERRDDKESAQPQFGIWRVAEQGALCTILKNRGVYVLDKNSAGGSADANQQDSKVEISLEAKLTVWAQKPWVEVSYRLINTSEEELDIAQLGFYCKAEEDSPIFAKVSADTTYRTKGTAELSALEKLCPVEDIRTCVGYSNYKTDFTIGADGAAVVETVTSKRMMSEMNEHFSEVFYGTFFADRTDAKGGICATIYQAQQNYPKAVRADRHGIAVMLVPSAEVCEGAKAVHGIGDDRVVMQPGMSREQRFMLHFHSPEESLAELDNRSLIYQMPDRPVLNPKVFKEAGVMPDIFPGQIDPDAEIMLMRKADGHNRVFGMLNWGDTYDANYSSQGRGGNRPVWVNNEYDYPHACALMYARTGVRRFLDYLLVSASHWMDVDICHYSSDPLRLGGQVEHTCGHVVGGKIIVSHEWVEGLLDYYHFTGDERALDAAVGIGENVLRLLETPQYSGEGEISARETGWALRTLTALYEETGQEKWLAKCEWIVGHFKSWEEKFGYWLSPYTDNTLVRVGFMISVAVGSLMRYYRVCPTEELRHMMIRAIDDLVENCRLENGLFYYKELPSLKKVGVNTLLLEAMAIGYELTGDKKYVEAGIPTYRGAMKEGGGKPGGMRVHVEDAVIWPGESAKNFGQGLLPLACFDCALEKAGFR